MKQSRNKIISSALVFFLALGFLGVGRTSAYYSDTEISTNNLFAASMLDFDLFNSSYSSLIGPEALGEKTHASIAMPAAGSLPMQYNLTNSVTSQTGGLCDALTVEAKQNGVVKYTGALSGLAGPTSTDFGSWEFRFDLPISASVAHGDVCNLDAVFSAWRADTALPADSGFTDEERTSLSFTARMVVLNEIFANPNGGVAPKDREYIELYNNGNAPVDVLGWQISEIAGVTEIFYPIVASGAVAGQVMPYGGASTIIPAGGFLVLEFGGSAQHLNNSGDTVKLYDNVATLLDSHTYPGVAAGKAVVRFPDGIGFWVDPEPTPGTTNLVSMEDLLAAGFDEETIKQIIELATIKNVALLPDSGEEKIIEVVAEPTEEVGDEETGATTETTEQPEGILSNDEDVTTEEVVSEEVAEEAVPEEVLLNEEEITPEPEADSSPSSGVESSAEAIVSEPEPVVVTPESTPVTEIIPEPATTSEPLPEPAPAPAPESAGEIAVS